MAQRHKGIIQVANRTVRQTAGNKTLWGRSGFLIRRLHQINVAAFLTEFEEWNLTPNQWGVLTVVAAAPGMSHTSIAAQCGIDRVNVRDIMIRLEKNGLMTQKRSQEDRRQNCGYITELGRLLLDKLEPNVRHAHETVLSPLSATEKATFLALLRRLVVDNNRVTRAPLLAQAEVEPQPKRAAASAQKKPTRRSPSRARKRGAAVVSG